MKTSFTLPNLRPVLLPAAALALLSQLVCTIATPMTTWTNVNMDRLSDALPNTKPAAPSSQSSAIVYSFTSSQSPTTHVLTSGSIHLPTRLTLSETFLLLFRRLYSLSFTNGILECLAIFWLLIGFTIGLLWGLSIYIKHRERHAHAQGRQRQDRDSNMDVTLEVKISRRPSHLDLLSPRSALSSPERRASYGLISPKSVRWAEQLTSDQPRTPPPEYQRQLGHDQGHVDESVRGRGEIDIGMCSSPTPVDRKRKYSTAYKSDRVRRVVAKLKTGGGSQNGYGGMYDDILALEGDLA